MSDDVSRIGEVLQRRGETLALAESLTGGLLAATFARASGASEWFCGGVVAYASTVKHSLLGVPAGPVVSEQAAAAMAAGAGRVLQAAVGLAVTGVGGPGPQEGKAPGTVWVATWPRRLGEAVLLHLDGPPESICEQVCLRAAEILACRLGSLSP
jgi:nicotinamide-nucleotide amidase